MILMKPSTIAQTVRITMSARGLTISGLARLASVNRPNLGRWLSGSGDITTATLGRILAALEMNVAPQVDPPGAPIEGSCTTPTTIPAGSD